MQFLEDTRNYNNSPYWSGAFAFRLQDSIAESDMLSFLAMELDGENNCTKVWERFAWHLSSTDIKTVQVMMNWNYILLTKYEDRESFLRFYLKTKGILYKITKGNSIAAKDEIFLKAYFLVDIEAKELQTEVKSFLHNTNTMHSETLELVHVDFRVHNTGNNLRNTKTWPGSKVIVRRVKTDDDVLPNKNDALARNVPFPNNHGKLLPSKYYHQFRKLYAVSPQWRVKVPPSKRHGYKCSNLNLT